MTRLVSVFLFLCSLSTTLAASQCYYPNGDKASDFPCDPDADESVCCGGGLGSVCMSNKLCLGSNGNTVRGSCTEKDWASSECAMYCLGADSGGTDLISCSNVTDSDTSYCCDHNAGCCNSGVGRFNVLPSEPDIWATWDREASQYTVVGTVFDGKPTSTTAQVTTSDVSSTTFATSAPITTTRETTTSAPTHSGQAVSASSEAPLGLSTGAKAGIGAGAGVGVVLIAAVAYLLWKTRKNDRAAKENKQTPDYHGQPSMNYAWQQPQSAPKEPQHPQELHGHAFQGYSVRAELPAHT
ncbi:hypothetical protein B0J13DRAFT_512381 [Dactylonectria estremocensis]|uniref:Mid2 domain-containing protein n=1 Tax=Dactylonectria estremocensis TaxID=1079267 RepID=A0A9P9IJN7_9HYPO|nr:hypothetical protein B0J13DRAFT_512381 [Dactylonectria estremocensis]